ncbi:serine/threonine-protein kinase [Anaeromyxobacter sp. SG17]|uniref:serine/threonine-protein kinase n=1 Tax=Anaeromyxobacter sp. SG17 TaxID=2925405 RepID=UPI001F564D8E|nr:serine/threonine-protein kinase [Anaeromyxobacter sp. SG17]
MPQAAPQASGADFKPHLFGKFFLLQRLAVGGMAEIYRARVPGAGGFEKELVVKRILPARAQDQGFIKMLVNEAKLTVQLTHSNIAQIYECGSFEGNFFISMELVNGVSLKEMMAAFAKAGTQLTPEQAMFLVLQLLQGLDYAHRKTDGQGNPLRIVHCDVSPDNALVSYEGEVKLLDFGIARAATNLSNYKEGMLMGKLGYVAPEQASLEKRWDHRVDLFAAGILLYELLTKQKPFPKATDVESLVQARKAKVVPPTAIDPRLPKDLDAIVASALAYDPDDRYPDARSFADALVDVLFPTPHSSIQDLLASQMKAVFADKVQRQRAARAHDPLIMKVLTNAAAAAGVLPGAAEQTPVKAWEPQVEAAPSPEPRRAPSRAPRTRTVVKAGVRLRTAFLVGLVVAVAGFAGLRYADPWLRSGVLVVTSDPPGADVTLDGAPTGLTTPAVIEDVRLARPHEIALGGEGLRGVTLATQPTPGRLVTRVHSELASAFGALRVESDPPGAEVRFDERPAGKTPITIPGVRLDERHRIDLTLTGHEIDQFVVLPAKDGSQFARKLARLDGGKPRP